MKARFLSILLALLTLSSTSALLASCGDSSDTPDETTTAPTTETTTVAETSEYTAPASNYNGKDFTIASYDYSDTAAVWKLSTYCEAYVEDTNGDIINDAIFERNAAVQEELNVNFKLFPLSTMGAGRTELAKFVLAGDHVCDIALMNGSGLPLFFGVKGEYLYDLNDLEGVDFSHSWWDQKSVEEFDILGRMYAVTGDISMYTKFNTPTYFFNKKVAENFKLGNLYDLVRSGKWTVDKLIEMCNTVSHDVNGDGQMTEVDAYGLSHQQGMVADMIFAADIRMTTKDKDGISQLSLNTDRTVTAVEKIVPFFNNDQITVGNTKFTNYNNIFKDLHLAMFMDNRLLFNYNQLMIAMDMRDMESDFGILPVPKLDESQENYVAAAGGWWSTYLIVPITNPDPKMTGEVCESMGYHSQQILVPACIDVAVMSRDLRDADSEEMLHIIFDGVYYDLGQYFSWGILSPLQRLGQTNDTNFSSMWAANEGKFQAAIDATFSGWEE